MNRLRRVTCALVALFASGCADDDFAARGASDAGADVVSPACAAGETEIADGGCRAAGLPPAGPCAPGELPNGSTCCAAGETPTDAGACEPAGVGACAPGFVLDGVHGCRAVLPAEPCSAGLMAVPGETECHEVAPCGADPWGDIPIDATTQFVDAAYAGGASDGSEVAPWTTIQAAVDAAAAGAVVAIAAGHYAEAVTIQAKPVQLVGRCPALVEIATPADQVPIGLWPGADGSSIRGVATSGGLAGIYDAGAEAVVVDHVWLHDGAQYGLVVNGYAAAASLSLADSLVESAPDAAVGVQGSPASLERVVLRGRVEGAAGELGVTALPATDPAEPADVSIVGSVVERVAVSGVLVSGSKVSITASVVRDSSPVAGSPIEGRGIEVQSSDATGLRGELTVQGSVVERARDGGVLVHGADAHVVDTVVRDTALRADGTQGFGIVAEDAPDGRSKLEVRRCVVEGNHRYGVSVVGSDATIEASRLVDTAAEDVAPHRGAGLTVVTNEVSGARAIAEIAGCALEHNHGAGIAIVGSDATIEGTLVGGTLAQVDGSLGQGITALQDPATAARPSVVVRSSVVSDNRLVGLEVGDGDATIESTVVRATAPDGDGRWGIGIAIERDPTNAARPTATIRGSLVEDNLTVAILLQGCDASLEATAVRGTRSQASDGTFGRAVHVEPGGEGGDGAVVSIVDCELDDNADFGVFGFDSQVTVESTRVSNTRLRALGDFGDGIAVLSKDVTSELVVARSRIESSARAGVASFGSHVTLEATALECNAIQLDGETVFDRAFSFSDVGANRCACGPDEQTCKVLTADLAPPVGGSGP